MCAGYSAADVKCYNNCDVNAPNCPCGRRCVTITGGSGAACLPANTQGERCGNDGAGKPYGFGACEQGLICAGPTDTRYCVPTCTDSSTCAAQTSCKDVVDNLMVTNSVCWFNSNMMMGKAVGEACDVQTFCQPNALCAGGMCRQQCGGAADATCTSGSCMPLSAGGQVFAYVCM
jgi:hypothetical protein